MLGPQCCVNPPTFSSSSGNGSLLQLGGVNTYVSDPSTSKHAILFVSDIYDVGIFFTTTTIPENESNCWRFSDVLSVNLLVTSREEVRVTVICVCPVIKLQEVPMLSWADRKIQLLCRKLADKVAAAGYYVVVPDFFNGDPYNPENTEKPLSIWFESYKPDKGFEDAKQVVAALKDKGISAIGAAGFCWGAKVVTDLAKSDNIQAAVLLHPSLVKVDDFKEVEAPIAILAAEIDKFCPPELIKQYEEILSSKPEVDKFVKIFPSVKHGWTVRYNVEDKEAVQHAEEAHRDMLDWLTKHIKYSQKGSGYSSVQCPRSSM